LKKIFVFGLLLFLLPLSFALTPNGTLNYTKYMLNPVGNYTSTVSYPPVAHGEPDGFFIGSTLHYYFHTQDNTLHRIIYGNTTNPFNLNTNQMILGEFTGYSYEALAIDQNMNYKINGNYTMYIVDLSNTSDGNLYVFASPNPMGPFKKMCGGPVIQGGDKQNPSVIIDNRTGNVHVLLEQIGSTVRYWNATSICGPYTDQGSILGSAGNAWMALRNDTKTNTDVFIVLFGKLVGGAWRVDYYRGNTLKNLTQNQTDVLHLSQSWEQTHITDPAVVNKTYVYYLGDQNNTGAATDAENRTFSAIYDAGDFFTDEPAIVGSAGSFVLDIPGGNFIVAMFVLLLIASFCALFVPENAKVYIKYLILFLVVVTIAALVAGG
jgi:hypothetical protein